MFYYESFYISSFQKNNLDLFYCNILVAYHDISVQYTNCYKAFYFLSFHPIETFNKETLIA